MVVLALALIYFFVNSGSFLGKKTQEVSYSEFVSMLESGQLLEVQVDTQSMKIEFSSEVEDPTTGKISTQSYIAVFTAEISSSLEKKLDEQKSEQLNLKYSYRPQRIPIGLVLIQVLPWILIIGLFFFMMKNVQGSGSKAFSFGKSKARQYKEGKTKVRFEDVAGQEEAKNELVEVVEFLKEPRKFTEIGATIPKGVLLVGSPGTGKTLLARAVAGEAGVSFFHMSGSDFVEMFVGVGASRVRDLFDQGRKNAPCIIFIDELDAVGRTRGAGYGGGHDEREQTLNQMLVEMDGFDGKEGIIVLAATNRPDVLDSALLRPGRFDRQVVVDLPDVKEREAILKIHTKKIKVGADIDLYRIARATPGTSGADLANLVNEAALFAARRNSKVVGMQDFEEARDKMAMGIARKSKLVSEKERLAVAYHEGGHALLHYYLKNADPLHKVTVIPRGRAGGITWSLPEDDSHIPARSWFVDKIKVAMGGYVAEKIIYGESTAGVSSDIKFATRIARKMVKEFGMSDLGFLSFGDEDEPIFLGKEIAQHHDYSEKTSERIDSEIERIIAECYEDTYKILSENVEQLHTLAKALVENETMEDCEIRKLLNLPEAEKSTKLTDVNTKKETTKKSDESLEDGKEEGENLAE
ncbi:MAG: ATP-dependent zinc metalloprotease FtsH [Spirochaetales bacterium]|nr:ATP-dependent zinc metalloprotease FtsH [Spirochaetales bacterium]